MVIAMGVNDLGLQVAAELRGHGDEVSFVEDDATRARRAESAGYGVIEGPVDVPSLEQLPAGQVETVLALHEDDRLNYRIAARAKDLRVPNMVAPVKDPARLARFTALGVQPCISAMHGATMIYPLRQ